MTKRRYYDDNTCKDQTHSQLLNEMSKRRKNKTFNHGFLSHSFLFYLSYVAESADHIKYHIDIFPLCTSHSLTLHIFIFSCLLCDECVVVMVKGNIRICFPFVSTRRTFLSSYVYLIRVWFVSLRVCFLPCGHCYDSMERSPIAVLGHNFPFPCPQFGVMEIFVTCVQATVQTILL